MKREEFREEFFRRVKEFAEWVRDNYKEKEGDCLIIAGYAGGEQFRAFGGDVDSIAHALTDETDDANIDGTIDLIIKTAAETVVLKELLINELRKAIKKQDQK